MIKVVLMKYLIGGVRIVDVSDYDEFGVVVLVEVVVVVIVLVWHLKVEGRGSIL